ncbi:hypothetical protein LWI28_027234 [Acer negundo]|uniref:Leucine-rich repeat-containing N-terminal plant-type domain-containing protein n=1 Tax=Acer negundo TaxID=4023 RepID=A0AAD5IGI4_ACENE|nr:hypothetical protein LWI28_027234 [Acer negundo]
MALPTLIKRVFTFSLIYFSLCVASDSTQEVNALLRWKSSLQIDQNPSPLTSWSVSDHENVTKSPCSWPGISCNNAGNVISINLTGTGNLNGTLDEFSFLSFPHLSYLNLSKNHLFGTIPPHIGNLSNLKYLNLSTNQLSGEIPREIGLLTHLEVMRLVKNHLDGSIPREVGVRD